MSTDFIRLKECQGPRTTKRKSKFPWTKDASKLLPTGPASARPARPAESELKEAQPTRAVSSSRARLRLELCDGDAPTIAMASGGSGIRGSGQYPWTALCVSMAYECSNLFVSCTAIHGTSAAYPHMSTAAKRSQFLLHCRRRHPFHSMPTYKNHWPRTIAHLRSALSTWLNSSRRKERRPSDCREPIEAERR